VYDSLTSVQVTPANPAGLDAHVEGEKAVEQTEFRVSLSQPFRVVDERMDGDAVVFTVVVPEDCPFFEGHFPERPVLPAIGQLAMLTALVRRVSGSSVSLSGIDGFRLSRQVLPGDRINIRLGSQSASNTVVFEIRCDGAPVSRGTVRVAAEHGG